MGDAVGLTVECVISQAAFFVDDRYRVTTGGDASFEQAMQRQILRIVDGGGIEGFQQLPAFSLWQHRQVLQRRFGALLQGIDQTVQGPLHIGADPPGRNHRNGLGGQQEVLALIVDVEGQRIVGAFLTAQGLHAVPGRQRLVGHGNAAVAIVEQGAEQRQRRAYAAATLGQRQGRMLMAEQRGQFVVGGLDPFPRAPTAEDHPQRQGIDKHAQGTVGTFATLHPAHQHGAEHHVVAGRNPAQYLGPGQMHQAGGTDPQLAGLGPQTATQRNAQRQAGFIDTLNINLLQAEWQGRLVDSTESFAEETLVLFLAHAQASLGHIVTIRYRRAQLRLLAQQIGLHLVLHHIHRGVVHGQVMEQQQGQPALVLRIPGMDQAQHRCLADIQTIVPRVETLVQLARHSTALRVRLQALAHQLRLTPDHLHRLVEAFPDQRGAQDVMTLDHELQGVGEFFQALLAVEGELRLQHVGVTLLRAEVVIENAGLQRRQGIDILDVGNATRHRGDDPVDGGLVQVRQRQQFRGDPRTIEGDAIGRHADFTATAHRRGQRGQGRLAEQHPHIGAQAGLAHTLDQRHRQQ
ncbi:hypothetical protein UCMB321_5575 [Pseudomonas batumici]|uniref:Uncharacterized protein n=1 Tax=Pseudomonas batumici TaxID=226910 RepID=A0A0C2HU78_9PSED|nr:hypothetical protein UCMB321_5575 [Pseudomonas batumici]